MNLRDNLHRLEDRIQSACARAGRTRNDVTLVAVTKTHPSEIVKQAYDLGLRDFGENRVQELLKKKEDLDRTLTTTHQSPTTNPQPPTTIHWHLIGQLQSNKAKYIAPFVHMVHSIDSLSTATELSKRAALNDRTISILIEVNVAGEDTKSGIAPSELSDFLDQMRERAPALIVDGLMTVAPFSENAERVRPVFAALRGLATKHNLRGLSMGMTNDFEVAIEEGATLVRVGSALFGERE